MFLSKHYQPFYPLNLAQLILLFSLMGSLTISHASVRQMRILESNSISTINPTGIAFSSTNAFGDVTCANTLLSVERPDVLGNDTDVENDTLTTVLDSSPTICVSQIQMVHLEYL